MEPERELDAENSVLQASAISNVVVGSKQHTCPNARANYTYAPNRQALPYTFAFRDLPQFPLDPRSMVFSLLLLFEINSAVNYNCLPTTNPN